VVWIICFIGALKDRVVTQLAQGGHRGNAGSATSGTDPPTIDSFAVPPRSGWADPRGFSGSVPSAGPRGPILRYPQVGKSPGSCGDRACSVPKAQSAGLQTNLQVPAHARGPFTLVEFLDGPDDGPSQGSLVLEENFDSVATDTTATELGFESANDPGTSALVQSWMDQMHLPFADFHVNPSGTSDSRLISNVRHSRSTWTARFR
jgi:hypothetical protein